MKQPVFITHLTLGTASVSPASVGVWLARGWTLVSAAGVEQDPVPGEEPLTTAPPAVVLTD